MKKDQLAQLKKKELDSLQHAVAELKEKLSRLLFDLKSGKTAVLKEVRALRKEIAVHMTLIKQKALGTRDQISENNKKSESN